MAAEREAQIETALARQLKAEIRARGPMPIADFMARCLWDERHGYYATRSGIGAAGDFITASEISQIFGELIGLWAAVVWQQALAAPASLRLVEYGPGRGTLMADALRATRVVAGFHNATSVRLIEMSEVMIAHQRQALSAAPVPVSWSANLADIPAPAILIANEFLDAWPLTQWVSDSGGWRRRCVALTRDGAFCFAASDHLEGDDAAGHDHSRFAPGSIIESHDLKRFAAALARIAQTGPMAALIIDYGHTVPASGDTLQAVRGHRYESPLTAPGEADLTAHVDFAALALALHDEGLTLDGPVTQAEFLGSLGLLERASRLMHANSHRAGEIEAGVARLIAPNGMGTRFKVMGVRHPDVLPLPGFTAAQ
jgi:NADH dehydrogenase [ubiquinone] 1 alpha subcomplex assembly factor 7